MHEAQSTLNKATEYLARQQYEEAYDLFRSVLERYPKVQKYPHFQLQLGQTLIGLGKFQQAKFELKDIVGDNSGASVWLAYGNSLLGCKEHEDAITALRKALSLDESLIGAKLSKAQCLLSLHRFQEAYALMAPVVSISPTLPVHKVFLFCCSNLGREPDGLASAEFMFKALSTGQQTDYWHCSDKETVGVLSRTFRKCASNLKSLTLWQKACVVEPSAQNILGLGIQYLNIGDLDGSEKAFKLAAHLNKTEWQIYYYLGIVAFRKNDFSTSASRFQEAIDHLSPLGNIANKVSRLQLYLGISLLNDGNVSAARYCVNQSAHGAGPLKNNARLLLAAMDIRNKNRKNAMYIMNMVRRDVEDLVSEGNGRGNAIACNLITADLARSMYTDTIVVDNEKKLYKLFELERSCYRGILKQQASHELALLRLSILPEYHRGVVERFQSAMPSRRTEERPLVDNSHLRHSMNSRRQLLMVEEDETADEDQFWAIEF